MIERYSRKELKNIWSDENKYKIWLDIELAAAEAMEKFKIIPKGVVKKVKSKAKINVARILKIEESVKHDVIAFLTSITERAGKEARFLHKGMTSSDVLDTCFNLQLKQSSEIILNDIKELLKSIKKQALKHKMTLCIGRSHGIHAEPITFGFKMLTFYQEFLRNKKRLENAIDEISTCAISGAVGTFANIDPRVEGYVAKKLKLKIEPISTQIIPRDRHAQFFATLGIIASSIERLATEIRHLQRTEVLEVEEFFGKKQKGSSAMPHKKNPIGSERITGLARIMRSYVSTSLENMVLWNERDISNSSVERIMLPDAFHLISFMSIELNSILKNLVINYEQINMNIEDAKNKSVSQKYLSYLVNNGVDRDTAYRKIQEEIFNDLSAAELKKELEKEFNLEFPDLENQVHKNVDEKTFKDKFK